MKHKLKKLEQILAENPGWYATSETFFFRGTAGINFSMIHYLGKEVDMDHPSVKVWIWDESWFEQPVKKKLYAYSDDDGDVVFSKRPNRNMDYLKREPEFDIEYDDEK